MRKIITISLLLVMSTVLSSCATRSSEQVFESTLRAYERVIRWGDISKANQFRKQPIVFTSTELKRFKQIKVTGYTTYQVNRVDDSTINVDVSLTYYHTDYVREKSLDDHQRWEYDADKNLWFITSPLPEF